MHYGPPKPIIIEDDETPGEALARLGQKIIDAAPVIIVNGTAFEVSDVVIRFAGGRLHHFGPLAPAKETYQTFGEPLK